MYSARWLVAALVMVGGCGADSNGSDGGGGGGSGDCVEPTGAGTMHNSIMADETWTAAASPHVLPYDTTIYATVTLEPCAVVRIGAGKTVTVSPGRIVAKGTEQHPIAFAPLDPSAPWATIRAIAGGTLDLEWVGLLGGGDPLNISPQLAAALELRADQAKPPAEVLHADHLLIQDSASGRPRRRRHVGQADRIHLGQGRPAAGDWLGLSFGSVTNPATRLDNVIVQYAGGSSLSGSESCPYPATPINDAAIPITGEPATAFITNTQILDSAAHGIDRGFRSDIKPSFVPTNTFTRIVGCTETYPRDVAGACPTPVPCP